jgi:hypothetical protein
MAQDLAVSANVPAKTQLKTLDVLGARLARL